MQAVNFSFVNAFFFLLRRIPFTYVAPPRQSAQSVRCLMSFLILASYGAIGASILRQ